MRTRMQRWGNSLALRVPKPFADEPHLRQEALVDLSLIDGRLVVSPVIEPEVTLAGMLGGVTTDNVHHEVDAGRAIGNEVW